MINEKLDKRLIESLKEFGFSNSKVLQSICIPKIKSGRDLLCLSSEKAGRTSTIIVSVIQKLKHSVDDNPRAIILVSSTEEAIEMKAAFDKIGNYTDLRVHTACDNEKIDDQKDKIYMGSDVVIGTAKRLNQIYSLYALNLGVVKILAIDNAELVIKNFTYPQIDRLSESLPKIQRIVFANNITEWIERYANEYMMVDEILEIEEEERDVEPEN